MSLSQQSVADLRSILDRAVTGETAIPGMTFTVVAKDGTLLFNDAAGKRGSTSPEAMSTESVFWIASCTKMLTGLACMQLVEKRQLELDSADQLHRLLPELNDVKVLKKDGTLEPRKRDITLRMLLSHTSGFSYTFFNDTLRDWTHPVGLSEFSGDSKDIMMQPLVHQPGEGWEYGVGIDWAGLALERVTRLKLNDYIQNNICKPLGLEQLTMFPTPSMMERLAYMHQNTGGKITVRDHLQRRPLMAKTEEERDRIFHSGGAGMFSRPSDYCRVLAALLNNGTCPTTGTKLLEPSTVDEMFRNQVPEFPNLGRQGIPDAKPDLTNAIPDIYALPKPDPQGWGLTFMLTSSPTGRPATGAWWAGLANLYWWCDRENGVAGMVCTQILPFADAKVLGTWFELESVVYRSLGVAAK